MSNKYIDRLLEYANWKQRKYEDGTKPVYRILLFELPGGCEALGKSGEPLGCPDTGLMDEMGFYYDLDTAIRAMHENWADIHEDCYFAGFIICTFPGLYPYGGEEARIYFEWDDEKRGFFEVDEPEIFKHYAY